MLANDESDSDTEDDHEEDHDDDDDSTWLIIIVLLHSNFKFSEIKKNGTLRLQKHPSLAKYFHFWQRGRLLWIWFR